MAREGLRVRFELEVDEDGYPPIGSESLNGEWAAGGLVRLDNTPFFVEGVALGDLVECSGQPPTLDFVRLHRASGNKSLAIIFLRRAAAEPLYQRLKALGCYCEYGEFPAFDMLAVSVPEAVAYEPIRAEFERLEDLEEISFAELCIY